MIYDLISIVFHSSLRQDICMSSKVDPKISENKFLTSVLGAATQGAAGAVIGALLASVTDPVTNRLLVKRMTLGQAIAEVDSKQCLAYFRTTLPTNFIKFPLFEVLSEVTGKLELPASLKGVVAGVIFTTATLPLTNYRYCKSVQEEVSMTSPKLWKAYIPTVVRDVIYANARNQIATSLARAFPDLSKSVTGKFLSMFITVIAASLVSSPGNEWRGYTLQPADRRKPVSEFFQFERYLRSTIIGAVVMGLSLGVATVVSPPIQSALPKVLDRRFLILAVALAVAYQSRNGAI